MKIAKALKLKNQLAGEVAHLKDLLAKQNSRCRAPLFPLDGVVSLHAGLKSRKCRRNPDSSGYFPTTTPLRRVRSAFAKAMADRKEA
jgi:hypothetical protein